MADPTDDMLREAARARGFRLVKSRRRKPGGDFGRYGLVELASGRECMGFGEDGLTATADEVLAYLRGGELASWKRSLIGVVGEEPKKAAGDKGAEKKGRSDEEPRKDDETREADGPARPEAKTKRDPTRGGRKPESPAPAPERPPPSLRVVREEVEERPPASPPPAIREAARRDAAAIAKLLGIPAAALADRLAAAIRADEPPLIAEQDGIVGIAAWTTVATLQRGTVGRITALCVAKESRRQGLGTRLLAETEERMRDAGVETLELAIEIDFDAPTGFLRHAGFARTTNGYAKALE